VTGSIAEFKADPLALFLDLQKTYGDVVSLQLATTKSVLLSHPDHVQYVLRTNRRNYSKRTRGIQYLREILGDGLLTIIDEDRWVHNRRTMQPVFRHDSLDNFAAIIAELTAGMLDEWGEQVPVAPNMTRLTLKIAGRCFFATELGETDDIGRAFVEVMEINQNRFRAAFCAPLWMPTAQNRRFRRALNVLHTQMVALIEERRAAPGDDLLSRLIEACDEETGEGLLTDELRDEAITMLGAGHETTANALIFTLDLLARNPDQYALLRKEALAGWSGDAPTLAELKGLTYTNACINESMRLNPPAWVFGRLAEACDNIGGFDIEAGTLVMMSPFVTHRRADIWDDPLEFRPERFIEKDPDRHPFAFYPFSGGPRSCIGKYFGMMEMLIIVSMIARHCPKLTRINPEVVGWDPLVTLRPKDDVPIRVV